LGVAPLRGASGALRQVLALAKIASWAGRIGIRGATVLLLLSRSRSGRQHAKRAGRPNVSRAIIDGFATVGSHSLGSAPDFFLALPGGNSFPVHEERGAICLRT